jgi:hypothetical protein
MINEKGAPMTRQEYEEAKNRYDMAFQDLSAMLRCGNPTKKSWRDAQEELAELKALIKEYEEEHQ